MIVPAEIQWSARKTLPTASFILALVIVLGVAAEGQAGLAKAITSPVPATPAQQPSPVPSPAVYEQAIPLPDVAERAEEVDRQLRDIANELIPSNELLTAEEAIKSQVEEIKQRALQTEDLLPGMPSPIELQEEERYWRALAQDYSSYRKLLAARASSLGDRFIVLERYKSQWRATLGQIHTVKGIEPVLDRIGQTLNMIEERRSQTETELARIVNLQTQTAKQYQIITQVIGSVEDTRKRMRERILQRDSVPIWQASEEQDDHSIGGVAYRSLGRGLLGIQEFLRTKKLRLVIILLLYAAGLWTALHFKSRLASASPDDVPPEAVAIFARPYAVALSIALLGTIGEMLSAPPGIPLLVYVLYYVLLIRLGPAFIDPQLFRPLVTLGIACFAQGTYLLIQASPLTRRGLFITLTLAALAAFAWLTRPSAVREWKITGPNIARGLLAFRFVIGLLAVSILANIIGFVLLSHTIGTATLMAAYAAVLLYIAARVVHLMLLMGLRAWAHSLAGKQRKSVENWSRRILSVLVIVLWAATALYLLGLRDWIKSIANSALSYPIGFNKVHVTPGDVLGFLLVLFVGYFAAKILAFALRELLLAKMRLQHGLPDAVATITYYILLVLVFVAALLDAGVELNRFTVITGALGIGVGFGLQNMFNNFVSGLLLLFERPIRLGDTIEIEGVVGKVRRIGVRSCTIETFQDAEVIVPNSHLISNQVTNWTLSSPWRRVEIPLHVAYGTDPRRLIPLLMELAESHERVRDYPRPLALFVGFGENGMNFELRFWTSQEFWLEVKSEVTVHIYRALQEAGISIPLPQRDLHVSGLEETSQEAFRLTQTGREAAQR